MTLIVEADRVIFLGPDEEDETKHHQHFGAELIYGEWTAGAGLDYTENPEDAKLFIEQFDYIAWDALSSTDFYQGRDVMLVIRRKSDGRLFGFGWWYGGGKYGEPIAEPNGDDHGFGYGDVVFEPVETFKIEGYKFSKSS